MARLEDLTPGARVTGVVAGQAVAADGALFRLVSEARRIQLAYLFDPLLAVSTSNVMPLPHEISAMYEEMHSRQPLHFLLADDPLAGSCLDWTASRTKRERGRGPW